MVVGGPKGLSELPKGLSLPEDLKGLDAGDEDLDVDGCGAGDVEDWLEVGAAAGAAAAAAGAGEGV